LVLEIEYPEGRIIGMVTRQVTAAFDLGRIYPFLTVLSFWNIRKEPFCPDILRDGRVLCFLIIKKSFINRYKMGLKNKFFMV